MAGPPMLTVALGVFFNIRVNTRDFCKTSKNNYDFGKNSGNFDRMNTKLAK
jgi:hypothetical protein